MSTTMEQEQTQEQDTAPEQTPLGGMVPHQLPAVALDSPKDYRLIATAIEVRAADLRKLAKGIQQDYPREARIIQLDADRLGDELLPPFKEQSELPLATADELRAGIANELRGLVRAHARLADDRTDHEAVLLDSLAQRIAAYTVDVAHRAFGAGLAYRYATAELIGLQSSEKLRFNP